MLKPKISQIVYDAAAQASNEEKVNFLRSHDSQALRIYLGMTIDQNLKWAIPTSTPPYTPNKGVDCETLMYQLATKMNRFLVGHYPNLSDRKRQELFISMLGELDADDAKFLVEVVVNKTLPIGLTREIVKEALPGMRV